MELPSERVEAGMTPSYREAISGPPSGCAITAQDKECLESTESGQQDCN